MVNIYLVFYQEEAWHGSVYSGDGRYYDDPNNLNKECIGVYRDNVTANHAALEYVHDTFDDDPDEENVCDHDEIDDRSGDGVLANFFWDAVQHGVDSFTLSKRVYVEKHRLKN
eukprot:92399_1